MAGSIVSTNSDAGGVAAKKGFFFQDHIAVRYLLKLLSDSSFIEIHCETKDDISALIYIDGEESVKHIQVKTTNSSKKWSTEEVNKSGIFRKQLSLDDASARATFQIISTREVGSSSVKYLILPYSQRTDPSARQTLINVLERANRGFLSPNGNGPAYWVDNCYWEVIKEVDAVRFRNANQIGEIASRFGFNLTTTQVAIIYDRLLVRATTASAASNRTEFPEKIFKKQSFEQDFRKILEEISKTGEPSKLPYAVEHVLSPFLTEIFFEKDSDLRTGHGLDIGVESKKLRVEGFSRYLKIWLPEFCLQASELSNLPTNHMAFFERIEKSTQRLKDIFSEKIDEILGNLALHACMRTHLRSEPIPCKLFYLTDTSKYKCFRNAHLVGSSQGQNQELWLGSSILTDKNFVDSIPECFEIIKNTLDPEFVKKERRVILDLFEPSHYSCSSITTMLEEQAPVDELMEVICVSILVIYRSSALDNIKDYKKLVAEEMQKNFECLKKDLPSELNKLKVYFFMIPAGDMINLRNQFEQKVMS